MFTRTSRHPPHTHLATGGVSARDRPDLAKDFRPPMLDSYRDLIDGLLETPTTLRAALGDPIQEGSIPDESVPLLRELRVREGVNLRRAQAIMRHENILLLTMEDEPEIKALAEAGWVGSAPEEDMAAFSHDRSELISLLVNLTLRDWERGVNHDRTGETTLADEIEDHLTWDEAIVAKLTAK
jgi:hypothetical protein